MLTVDGSTDGLVGCTWTEPGFYVMFMLCSLWMPQQMDLLHMDIVNIVKVYVMFAMDASADGCVVAHGYCYNFVVLLCYKARLVVEAAVLTFNAMCHMCTKKTDSWCDIFL